MGLGRERALPDMGETLGPRWDLASSSKLNSLPDAKSPGSEDLGHYAPIYAVRFGPISGSFERKRASLNIRAGL